MENAEAAKLKGYDKMKLTQEQERISRENNERAWQWFELNLGISRIGKHLHHLDTSLRHTNIKRYIQWFPFDLVVVTPSEHMKLHSKDSHNTWKNKIKGRIWQNNGKIEKHEFVLLPGFKKGRLKKSDTSKSDYEETILK